MLTIDFPMFGLDQSWLGARWVEFVDGQEGRPAWGVWLGHGSTVPWTATDPWAFVASLPRERHAHLMTAPGGDSAREVAFEALFKLANLTLPAPAGRPVDEGYLPRLVEFVGDEADRYASWPVVAWRVNGRTVSAHLHTWAGAWAAFTSDVPAVQVAVLGFGIEAQSLALAQVDAHAYHFDASVPISFPECMERSMALARADDAGASVVHEDEPWWPSHPDHARPMRR